MGAPKLLLTIGGETGIGRLLDALAEGGAAERYVVIRSADSVLREEIERHGGIVVAADVDPPDMRASVTLGLQAAFDHPAGTVNAGPADPWVLVPADHPL